ncbi:energy transducer TonB [Marinobacter sp. C2H3]|uniref:energy transducer TonB n=1 Tax=Marinobacter sp. C2H3 TaxID=3119003 RepID=UPI00300ED931
MTPLARRHRPAQASPPVSRHRPIGRWPTLWLLPTAITLTALLAASLTPDTLPQPGAVSVLSESPALRLRLAGPVTATSATPEQSRSEAAAPEPATTSPAPEQPEPQPAKPSPEQPEPRKHTRPAPAPATAPTPRAEAPEAQEKPAPSIQSGDGGDAAVTLNAGASERTDDYLSRLTRHLSRFYQYPRRARRLGQEGTAVVQFSFTRDGTLIDHRLSDSSGHDRLDQAALAMLAKAAPLPPVPDSMAGDRFRFALPVRFRLR